MALCNVISFYSGIVYIFIINVLYTFLITYLNALKKIRVTHITTTSSHLKPNKNI